MKTEIIRFLDKYWIDQRIDTHAYIGFKNEILALGNEPNGYEWGGEGVTI